MIPISAIAIILREILASQERRSSGAPEPASDPRLGLMLLIWIVVTPFLVGVGTAMLAGAVWLAPAFVVGLALLFPWTAARLVAVPLGMPRLAAYLALVPSLAFARDPDGGSALAAAWALCRQRDLDGDDVEWVAKRIDGLVPLRGAGLVAAGLLAAARGDVDDPASGSATLDHPAGRSATLGHPAGRSATLGHPAGRSATLDGARALLHGARSLSDRACPQAARRVAGDWLAAEAVGRGAWREVLGLGDGVREGRQAYLLGGVARALLIEPDAPGGGALWVRWLIASHRGATKPLVERAHKALDGAFIAVHDDDVAPLPRSFEGDALGRATALHSAAAAGRRPPSGDELRAVAHAWDEAFGARDLSAHLAARAEAIGGGDPHATLERMRADVEADLCDLALAGNVPLGELVDRREATGGAGGGSGGMTGRVRALLRDRLLREVEAACDALRRRVDERRELPPADEWREWDGVAKLHARGVALAGAEFRTLAFYKLNPDATHFAVWLFNERKQIAIAHAVFAFCMAEAAAVGDEAAAALQAKNVACGT